MNIGKDKKIFTVDRMAQLRSLNKNESCLSNLKSRRFLTFICQFTSLSLQRCVVTTGCNWKTGSAEKSWQKRNFLPKFNFDYSPNIFVGITWRRY